MLLAFVLGLILKLLFVCYLNLVCFVLAAGKTPKTFESEAGDGQVSARHNRGDGFAA